MKIYKNVMTTSLILIAIFIFVGIVSTAINYMATRNSDGYAPKGLAYTKETYVSACSYWARQEPGAEQLSDTFIESYCGCVYDDGIKQYGKEEFTKIDQAMSDGTTPISPEVNELINACITRTFNSGAM